MGQFLDYILFIYNAELFIRIFFIFSSIFIIY